jgi:hypothetical protein
MDDRSVKRLAVILVTALILILVFRSVGLKMATRAGEQHQRALAARQANTPPAPDSTSPAPDSASPAPDVAPPAPDIAPDAGAPAPQAAPPTPDVAPAPATGVEPPPDAPATPSGDSSP